MLNKVDKIINDFLFDLENDRILNLYKEISSGKKLRAKLILKIAGDTEDACFLAAIVEMIQIASLLHDDVIDDSDTRRGRSSINAIFGNKIAIMLGDILYSKAFYELNSLPNEVSKIISNSVTKLSIGELLDVELSNKFNPDKDKYFDMIYKKTASLIEASSYAAAYIGKKDTHKFALYGKNLGLAFQIIDDILDITMDSKTLGKPALSDFKEGKTTLPYIFLYEALNEEEKKKLVSFFKKMLNTEEKEWILYKMKEYNVIKKSLSIVEEFAKSALLSIKEYKNNDLEKIITDMVKREY